MLCLQHQRTEIALMFFIRLCSSDLVLMMLCDMHGNVINQSQIIYQTCQGLLFPVFWMKEVVILILFTPRNKVSMINIGWHVLLGFYRKHIELWPSECCVIHRRPVGSHHPEATCQFAFASSLNVLFRWWCWCWCSVIFGSIYRLVCLSGIVAISSMTDE